MWGPELDTPYWSNFIEQTEEGKPRNNVCLDNQKAFCTSLWRFSSLANGNASSEIRRGEEHAHQDSSPTSVLGKLEDRGWQNGDIKSSVWILHCIWLTLNCQEQARVIFIPGTKLFCLSHQACQKQAFLTHSPRKIQSSLGTNLHVPES